MDVKALTNYDNWIGKTAWDVYWAVIRADGWQQVFPGGGAMPLWASRIRQYFNLTPMTLKLLDPEESKRHLENLETAYCKASQKYCAASARATAYRKKVQSRGMGILAHVPGSSTTPGTPLVKPVAPNDIVNTTVGHSIGTAMALSDYVYEDVRGRSIWFQMSPGGAVYHFGEEVQNPTIRAIGAAHAGQESAPVFKLVCPDGTGGSREVCIKNPFDIAETHKTRIDVKALSGAAQ